MASSLTSPRFYTPQQFARVYQIQPLQIAFLLRKGILRGVKIGNHVRIEDPGLYLSIPEEIDDAWPVLRESEIAAVLGITPRMVRKLAEDGVIRPRRLPGKMNARERHGKRIYSMSDLRTLIAYRSDPEAKGAAKSAAIVKWAIEKVLGRKVEANIYATVTSDDLAESVERPETAEQVDDQQDDQDRADTDSAATPA
jgi:hypothetical protein